mgnify:CR=1 FL=1
MMYGLDGKWIKDINLPRQINKPKIEVNADGTLSVVHMPFEEGTPIAFRMDTNGNILSQIPALDYMLQEISTMRYFLPEYRDIRLLLYRHRHDFHIRYGSKQADPPFHDELPRFCSKTIHIYTELPNHILIHYYTWDKGRFTPGGDILVDKMKMSSSQYHLSTTSTGISRFPIRTTTQQGQIHFQCRTGCTSGNDRSPSRLRQNVLPKRKPN